MIADPGGNEEPPLAPLFAAMATEVHHVAARIGQASPGGRLDPPLLMALDEIVQVCPLPLPSLLADSGGKGIQIIPVVHGEAQLRTRWKGDGAQAVLDTCGVKVWLPGITDPDTLETASKLCGKTAFREKGQEHHTRHEVMTPGHDPAAARPGSPWCCAAACRRSWHACRWPGRTAPTRRPDGAAGPCYQAPARLADPLPLPGLAPAAPARRARAGTSRVPEPPVTVPAADSEQFPWLAGDR